MHPIAAKVHRLFKFTRIIRVIVAFAILYVVAIAALVVMEDRLIYHPKSDAQTWINPPTSLEFVEVNLASHGRPRIHARWYPCPNAKSAVLFCHSRAGNLTTELSPSAIEQWSRVLGCSVLIFDYPGFGRSEGRPSERGLYDAAELAYEWLTTTEKCPPSRIVIYGRSLGSAVAIELAGRRPHRGLILVSPLTSMPDVAFSQCPILPTRLLMRNRFESLSRIHLCNEPTLVVHGTRDRLIPFAQGQRIFDALQCEKRFHAVEGAGHGDCITPAFYFDVRDFLRPDEVPEKKAKS